MSDRRPIKYRISTEAEAQAVRTVRSGDAYATMVQDALINRVKDAHGPNIMRVTFDEFVVIRLDPEFESLAQYFPKLASYADGTPRERLVRDLLENEVGMYRGRVVVLSNNPGDAYVGNLVSVPEKIGE